MQSKNHSLPDIGIVTFVWQIFAFENWHKITWQLVGVEEGGEVFVGCNDGLKLHAWLINGVQRLIFIAVIAGLHLRLQWRVSLVRIRTRLVDETSLNSRTVCWVSRRPSVKEREVGNLRLRLLAHCNARMLKVENYFLSCSLGHCSSLPQAETQTDNSCNRCPGSSKTCMG